MNYVGTFSGKRFEFDDPKIEQIDPEDIAHALSQINRYNGHTLYPYSVAHHSVRVAELLERRGYGKEAALAGLLHDASEAYLGDVVSPIKGFVADYAELERKAMCKILTRCGARYYTQKGIVDKADSDVFCQEVSELFPVEARYSCFDYLPRNIPNDVRSATREELNKPPAFWKGVFLGHYYRLGGAE